MPTITLVTGNPNKLRELQAIAPKELEFDSYSVDLPEIQSLDLRAIVEDKAKKAYQLLKKPVIVEDISAGLNDLGGLPGPFYKFFRQEVGDGILLKLAEISSRKITIRCLAAYFDGTRMIFGEGVIHGTVVEARGEHGFGFDPYVLPDGETRTLAEMLPEEKNEISHRSQAFKSLLRKIEA